MYKYLHAHLLFLIIIVPYWYRWRKKDRIAVSY